MVNKGVREAVEQGGVEKRSLLPLVADVTCGTDQLDHSPQHSFHGHGAFALWQRKDSIFRASFLLQWRSCLLFSKFRAAYSRVTAIHSLGGFSSISSSVSHEGSLWYQPEQST